jgi:hypothetical protein
MIEGDHASARVWLEETIAADVPELQKVLARELQIVDADWAKRGTPPVGRSALTAPMPDPSVSWEDAFTATRDAFASGDYSEVARRFRLLAEHAPDAVAAARAVELRALAMESVPSDEPPANVRAREPDTKTVWYGWQTLIPDVVVLGLVGLQVAQVTDSSGVTVLGVVTYFLGGPTVHGLHGRVGTAFADLGLRIGIPLAIGGIGAALQSTNTDRVIAFVGGGAVGAGIAMATDAIFLAREDVRIEKAPPASAVSWRPIVAADRIGVAGTF